MKFKFELDRPTLIRIACIALILLLLPFSFELAFLIDIGGIDFAVTFMMVYLATTYNYLAGKWDSFKRETAALITYCSGLYLFDAKVFVPHAAASSFLLFLGCSTLLTCLFWLPAIYLSSGFML